MGYNDELDGIAERKRLKRKGWLEEPDKKVSSQVSDSPRICEYLLYSTFGEEVAGGQTRGLGRGLVRSPDLGHGGSGSVPENWDELVSLYGSLLVDLVKRSGVIDVGNAVGGLLESMVKMDFLGTYDSEKAGFRSAFYAFVIPRIKGYLTVQQREAKLAERCHVNRVSVADAEDMSHELSHIEVDLVMDQLRDATGTRGRVLPACWIVFGRTGQVKAKDVAEVLDVSVQMARKYLRALDYEEVASLLLDGEDVSHNP